MGTSWTIVSRARANRRRPTPEEDLLWQMVRGRHLGARIRRQHPWRNRIFDFYCPAARLAVELDGAHHEADFDEQRDADALLEGVLVIRFANHEVTGDIDAVLNEIHSWIKYRSRPGTQARPHHASPSPAAGEGD